MKQEEWYELAIEKGTSGDMVFDILRDWKHDLTTYNIITAQKAVDAMEKIKKLIKWRTEDTKPPFRVMHPHTVYEKINAIIDEATKK